jgi:hypothetical protein
MFTVISSLPVSVLRCRARAYASLVALKEVRPTDHEACKGASYYTSVQRSLLTVTNTTTKPVQSACIIITYFPALLLLLPTFAYNRS